jgi:hypothetical protein
MNIGTLKSPAENIFVMWVRCIRICSRLLVSFGSFAVTANRATGRSETKVVGRRLVRETHRVIVSGDHTHIVIRTLIAPRQSR